ncbi:MAG: ribonuclease HI [Myxococcota bacterium]
MPWERRYFKGKKVWVETDEQGEVLVEDGRVPMRYSNSEGAKIYKAGRRNISAPLDEDGKPVNASRKKGGSGGTKSTADQIQLVEGEVHESTDPPDDVEGFAGPVDGIIEFYTDGACSGNPGPCGYGWLRRDGSDYHEKCQYLGHGTNNIAELVAIKSALESVEDRSRPVRIYSDSSYSIGVLVKGWKAKANRELILEIRDLIGEFSDLELRKVKGHSGHPLNERADHLATSTLDEAS